jgi:hypothetical protein
MSKLVETFNGTSLGSASNPRKDEVTKEKPLRTLWLLKDGEGKRLSFKESLATWYPKDMVKNVNDVDVKNLLEGKRIVIEKDALDSILKYRQADIRRPINVAARRNIARSMAKEMAEAVAETEQIKKQKLKELEEDSKRLQEDIANVTADKQEPPVKEL